MCLQFGLGGSGICAKITNATQLVKQRVKLTSSFYICILFYFNLFCCLATSPEAPVIDNFVLSGIPSKESDFFRKWAWPSSKPNIVEEVATRVSERLDFYELVKF